MIEMRARNLILYMLLLCGHVHVDAAGLSVRAAGGSV
jgi:hypothetical protein